MLSKQDQRGKDGPYPALSPGSTRRVGVEPAGLESQGASQASKSKLLGQDMQHKGFPCVWFGGFRGGGGVMLVLHPAAWKRAGSGTMT